MATSTADAVRLETKDWWNSSLAAQRTTMMTAKRGHRQLHDEVEPPRNVRNSKRPKTKYSVTCPAFLINTCMKTILWDGILSAKKRSNISIQEKVFCEENVSVDIQKIKHIQRITGSQYLVRFRLKIILTLLHLSDKNASTGRDTEDYIIWAECFCGKEELIKQIFRPELAELFQRFLPILYDGNRVLTILNGL